MHDSCSSLVLRLSLVDFEPEHSEYRTCRPVDSTRTSGVYIRTTGDWTSNVATLPKFKEKFRSPYTSHPSIPNTARPKVHIVTCSTDKLNQERYRHCMYDVTLRCILVTIAAVEKQ